ncbi:MAG: DUF4136 domain-containing protein [Desulfopila sp.]
MKNGTLFILAALLWGLTGCSGVQVSSDYDQEMSFTGLHTYTWRQPPESFGEEDKDVRESDPLLHKRIVAAINRGMSERGYRRADPADMQVSYSYSVETRLESEPHSGYFGFGTGRYPYYGGLGVNVGSDIRQYDVGILVIDIYDSRSGSLMWRGKGSAITSTHSTPEKITAKVNTMVRGVLAQFPPDFQGRR